MSANGDDAPFERQESSTLTPNAYGEDFDSFAAWGDTTTGTVISKSAVYANGSSGQGIVGDQAYRNRLMEVLEDDGDVGQDRSFEPRDFAMEDLLETRSRDSDVFGRSWALPQSGMETPKKRDDESDFGEFAQGPTPLDSPSAPLSLPSTASPTPSRIQRGTPNSYKRPSYLHPSISRLRAHGRQPSSSSMISQTYLANLSSPPAKPTHTRANSTASHLSGLSRDVVYPNALGVPKPSANGSQLASERQSMNEEGNGSIASGLAYGEGETEQTAFTFQTLRTATDLLFKKEGDIRSPAKSPIIGGPEGSPGPPKRSFSLTRVVAGKRDAVVDEPVDAGTVDWGVPVVLDVNGMIALGTDKGWTVVLTFKQEVQCVLGSELIAESGAVTAIRISSDQTFVAAGHANGNVYLYDLSNPAIPARSAPSLPLSALATGRKEGHVLGTPIVAIDFVGKRHTAVVTSDTTGRVFWWSLGKVMGIESNDVVRLLGNIPEPGKPEDAAGANGSALRGAVSAGKTISRANGGVAGGKKTSGFFTNRTLPLGKTSHPTDTFFLTALLTSSKLMVVGLKPKPKTWFRQSRGLEGGDRGRAVGCAAWLPAGARKPKAGSQTVVAGDGLASSNPVLAYAWGNMVRLLEVRGGSHGGKPNGMLIAERDDVVDGIKLEFKEILRHTEDEAILAIDWLYPSHLLLVTASYLSVYDVEKRQRVERSTLSILNRLSRGVYSGGRLGSFAEHRLAVFRGKIFMLTDHDIRAGSLLLWADRILALCHTGDFLSAIRLVVAYYLGIAPGNTIGLPSDESAKQSILRARATSLMRSSLEYAFSDDRLTDGTYDSPDGRGVDLTPLYEGLAATCLKACLAIGETTFAYEEVYEAYQRCGIHGIYLEQLEHVLLESRLRDVPPNLIQALIKLHDERGQYDKAENIIWHVDPLSLDIHQAVSLCEAQGLWDAYIYVHNQCMQEYIAPIAKFLSLMDESADSRLPVHPHQDRLPPAYKVYAYLETVLQGNEFPDGRPLPAAQGDRARRAVYDCLLDGRDPFQRSLVYWRGEDKPGPSVLRGLLQYDTEACLHVLDIAFEDGFLNDNDNGHATRQVLVERLLYVMTAEDFALGDITFMHIFIARNLPKYPQFIRLPYDTLHQILVSLASDPDDATREDRQLAAEYLLSAYRPADVSERRSLYTKAGFFRILRQDYQDNKDWAGLIRCLPDDPHADVDETFSLLGTAFVAARSSSMSLDVTREAGIDALPGLLQLSIPLTAVAVDMHLASGHTAALEMLHAHPVKQLAYLRALLEPEVGQQVGRSVNVGQVQLPPDSVALYIQLLCRHDRPHVLPFLQTPSRHDMLDVALPILETEGAVSPAVWCLSGLGRHSDAISRADRHIEEVSGQLASSVQTPADIEAEGVLLQLAQVLQDIRGVVSMAIEVCIAHESATSTSLGSDSADSLWFNLLSTLVTAAQGFIRLQQDLVSSGGPPDSTAILLAEAISTLRQTVQDTLSALVSSSTSSTSSFPALFKQLVRAAEQNHGIEQTALYSEFRLILVSMLDTYHGKEDMMTLVNKLLQSDVHHWLTEVITSRSAGWKIRTSDCSRCRQPLRETLGMKAALADGIAVILPRNGMAHHLDCVHSA